MADGAPPETGVLGGTRVVELGSYVAAPTTGRLLAAFGADVVKVERPGEGDESRRWHTHGEEDSLLWRSLGRGKRSVTVDVGTPAGRDLVLDLVRHSDVVLEGFRPGTMERLGLGPEELAGVNPAVILVRVSGFGQTGPYRDRAGFGSVAEAMGGLRFLTGYPDRPPTRVGVSLGDSVAGLYAAIGTLLALLDRQRNGAGPGTVVDGLPAETVDVALYEAVYSLLDSVVAEYDAFGAVRQRTGSTLPGVAPSNAYQCGDGSYVVIGANADGVFARLARAMGRPDLADHPRYAGAAARAAAADELDALVGDWVAALDQAEVMAALTAAKVPATPIFDAADLAADPHMAARGAHEVHEVALEGRRAAVRFPAPVPRLGHRPAHQRWAGPGLGEHTAQVLSEVLGLGPDDVARLAAEGVI
ncbi:MAG TPA: CaiB/BaiF CoA-transferase family protein [Acidimicrobiales bacterium]|nr:CaiB/BaiF CoA-transferase family protein [Acidimicrobiales bacterium]